MVTAGPAVLTEPLVQDGVLSAQLPMILNSDLEFEGENMQELEGNDKYRDDVVVRINTKRPTKMFDSYDYRNMVASCKSRDIPCEVWATNNDFIDIQIKSEILEQFMEKHKIYDYEVIIEDLVSTIQELYEENKEEDESKVQTETFGIQGEKGFLKKYRTLQEMYDWFDMLSGQYPSLVSVENFGKTYKGNFLKGLFISSNRHEVNPTNKTIIITAGLHAREWISISTANYILDQLLGKYGVSDPETNYIDHLNIFIIPVLNPDGYEYTWTNDRLWRKNRQILESSPLYCRGIDIDHSFSYQWADDHTWPCDEDYNGEYPLEAQEARLLAYMLNDTLKLHDHLQLQGFIDLHSYSQEILYPYSYSCDHEPRDKENLLELAYGLSKAIRINSNKVYNVFLACEDKNVDLTPGAGSGSLLDYMYSSVRAHWAFQIKLRDTGSHGFLLPKKFIVPVGAEVYEALKYFFDFILNPDL